MSSHLRHLGVHPLHPELVGGDGGRPLEDDSVPPVHRTGAPGLGGAGGAHPPSSILTVNCQLGGDKFLADYKSKLSYTLLIYTIYELYIYTLCYESIIICTPIGHYSNY